MLRGRRRRRTCTSRLALTELDSKLGSPRRGGVFKYEQVFLKMPGVIFRKTFPFASFSLCNVHNILYPQVL